MPRVNLATDKRNNEVKKLLKGYMIDRKTKARDVARGTGIPISTLNKDLREPEGMPLYRYRAYCDFLKVPREKQLI